MGSWHSYPSTYALGHKALKDLLLDPVLVEEKVDGSQFSFGRFSEKENEAPDGVLCRSKGATIYPLAPEKMFVPAVKTVMSIKDSLRDGWTYRAEFLARPKHNVLCYNRIPSQHLVIFDINTEEEEYLDYEAKAREAERLGLEVVPKLYYGEIADAGVIRHLLERESFLGGQKVEGVVVKNYARFGLDKKVLIGKIVSEKFKEIHAKEWRAGASGAPKSSKDIVQFLIERYRTPARWQKAVMHLSESGKLEQSPRDIGNLIAEVPSDIEKECSEEIKELLWRWAWPLIRRGVCGGLPDWYKQQLLEKQFEGGAADEREEDPGRS